ncbi:tRNA preQ1(34) S-adenosylmethionine ribosyltransferase-isomerase QueA [Salidesulfovibrio onnuriiensis]|uniref:tRNA preQ1(34) S-adenosylmethionine ribosyltransferase-isomerase QueA n=1 Tax=Salidesulfovibrio onnuriiensis TaxID=2583823 RepID=UPI0011C6F095|nr:tRNA preQ1(34) S-adenosylmethionine ribosyltransferase-isomerase QueA [Salidesulfovibrio onnuriiensis]
MPKNDTDNVSPDFQLESYDYHLPEERIAQQPADQRDASRLLVLDRGEGSLGLAEFRELPDLLPKGALLVANNSKVIPARMFGTKPTGGRIEFLLLTPLPLIEGQQDGDWMQARVEGLLRSSKPAKKGTVITILDDLEVIPEEQGDFGKWWVTLRWRGDLERLICSTGHLPLPPYIKRPDTEADAERYQTTYADDSKAGSVAAPTAGLHFTPEVRERLAGMGFEWAQVTLYVGYGTFSPVRCPDIRDHRMHKEYIEVPRETAEAIKKAKAEGRPVIAVGTTSARTLEGMFSECKEIREFKGETDIFIYPGYEFRMVDGLLTNFHLPESSLIIMVSALAGRETILEAYKTALDNGFRFFSYGDAMLIR